MKLKSLFLFLLIFSSNFALAEHLFLAEVIGVEIQYQPTDRTVYQIKVLDVLTEQKLPQKLEVIVDKVITIDTVESGRVLLVAGMGTQRDPYIILDVFPPEQEFLWGSDVFKSAFVRIVQRIIEEQNAKYQFTRQGVTELTLHFDGQIPDITFSRHHNTTDYFIVLYYYFRRVAEKFTPYIQSGTSTSFRVHTHEYETSINPVSKPITTYTLQQQMSGLN